MDAQWVKPLFELTYAVLDFETTRLYPERGDRVCEVGLVKLKGAEVIEEFSLLVNPQRSIPPDAVRVHGITEQMVADAPPFQAVLPQVLSHLQGCVLTTYNAPFELSFLRPALVEANITLPPMPCLDLLELARAIVRSPSGYSLEKVATFIGVWQPHQHRALADANTSADVLFVLLEKLTQQGCRTLFEVRSRFGEKVAFELLP